MVSRLSLHGKNNKDVYGKTLGLLVQLDITYSNGSKESVISDDSWKSSTGPITNVEIYHGERYDARLEKPVGQLPL